MAGKLLIIALALALLPILAFGATETNPRLDSIALTAMSRMGISTSGAGRVTPAKVYQIVNEGIEDVATHWPAVEKWDTVIVYDTAEGGPLPSDFVAIQSCEWIATSGRRVPLEYIPPDSLPKKFGVPEKADIDYAALDQGKQMLYYSTFGTRLKISPKIILSGSAVDSALFIINYYSEGKHLTAVTDSTDISPQFRRYLRWFVYAGIETLRGRYDKAAIWRDMYENAKPPRGRLAEGKK